MGHGLCCDSKEGPADEDGRGCSVMRAEYADYFCDSQSCLCAKTARGRLAQLGKLDEPGDLEELRRSQQYLQRVPHLFEPVEGDPVRRVHLTQLAWPSGTSWPSMIGEDSVQNCEALGPVSGKLELMASSDFPEASCRVSCGEAPAATLRFGKATKLFTVTCSDLQSVTSIDLRLDGGSMQANVGFGLRLRGQDLLSRLRVARLAEEDQEEVEDLEAFTTSLTLQAAHHGTLQPLPLGFCYRAESVVEFLAYGLDGTEELEVYVNGLTVKCGGCTLGRGGEQRRLLRFALCPLSCEIRSLTLGLRHGGVGGAVLDANFGLRLLGCDVLPGAHFIDRTSYHMNPHAWSAESFEQQELIHGQWTLEGYYFFMAYKRSKRPHRHNMLLGKPEKSKDKDTALPL